MASDMNELMLQPERPFIGKTGIFYDSNTDDFYFVCLKEYTTAKFHGVYQTCFKFTVGYPTPNNNFELVATMNHPDLTWNEMHPDALPMLIDQSLANRDHVAFTEYTNLLLLWEENLAACGGKVQGYNK